MGLFQDILNEEKGTSSGMFAPPAPKDPTLLNKTGEAAKNVSMGVVQGAISTGVNVGGAIEHGLDVTLGRGINFIKGKGFAPTDSSEKITRFHEDNPLFTNPQNGWQQLGFTGEKIAEFLAPAGRIGKLSTMAGNTASKILPNVAPEGYKTLLGLTGKAAVEGAAGGAITTAQTGAFGNEAKVNALISAAFPFLAKGASMISTSISHATIKPSYNDVKNGYKQSTLNEFGLTGNLESSLAKTETKLSNYATELNKKLDGTNLTLDVDSVVERTVERLYDKKSLVRGAFIKVNDGIADLKQTLMDSYKMLDEMGMSTKGRSVPLEIAQDIKQQSGARGAWAYGMPDKTKADAIDEVYTVFYNELKEEIERVTEAAGIKGVAQLNKNIGKLIPVKSALVKATTRQGRHNLLPIQDAFLLLGSVFDPRALYLYGANVALKNPAFASFLSSAAQVESAIPAVTKGIISGTASQSP